MTPIKKISSVNQLAKVVVFLVSLIGESSAFSAVNPENKNIWVGSFISGYVGGAWSNSNASTNVGEVTPTSHFASTNNINSVNQNGSPSLKANTFIGGVGLANNWMFQDLIYGLALDFGSLHLQKTNNAVNITYPSSPIRTYSLQTSINSNWLFTARGRLGFAPINWPFIYATGGLALTQLNASNSFNDTSASLGVGGSNNKTTKSGWTLGGGIQIPLASNWTLTSEYLYVNFGSVSVLSSINSNLDGESFSSPFQTAIKFSANIFRIGLSYKFL